MKDVIDNITIQESRLNKAIELIARLEEAINDWDAFLPEFSKLMNYYGSSDWFRDVEYSNNNMLDNSLKRGVLSEDGVYNTYAEQRELNIKMIRTALNYLEDKTTKE